MGTRKALDVAGVNYEDHPHAYGDKIKSRNVLFHNTGSSPRVWGQETKTAPQGTFVRIIPTRMGTRDHFALDTKYQEDHPHAYGDKFVNAVTKFSA